MLALMPHSPPVPDFYAAPEMSLAVLASSPVTYSEPAIPTLLPGPTPSKRPKLSLNTNDISPIFGKNATSLRLETLSATSPTARNTFRNTHSPLQKPGPTKPRKPTLTPLATLNVAAAPAVQSPPSAPTDETRTPPTLKTPSPAPSLSSTLDTPPSEPPYKLPFNAVSILTNSPLPGPNSLKTRTSFAQSRPMFPTPKKVLFKAPLTEEIWNTRFTMRHSDIEATTIEPVKPRDGAKNEAVDAEGASLKAATASPRTGDKRDSSDEEDEENDEAVPATPVAGRRKRHRQWRWTLGPVSPASPVKQRDDEVNDEEQDVANTGDI